MSLAIARKTLAFHPKEEMSVTPSIDGDMIGRNKRVQMNDHISKHKTINESALENTRCTQKPATGWKEILRIVSKRTRVEEEDSTMREQRRQSTESTDRVVAEETLNVLEKNENNVKTIS